MPARGVAGALHPEPAMCSIRIAYPQQQPALQIQDPFNSLQGCPVAVAVTLPAPHPSASKPVVWCGLRIPPQQAHRRMHPASPCKTSPNQPERCAQPTDNTRMLKQRSLCAQPEPPQQHQQTQDGQQAQQTCVKKTTPHRVDHRWGVAHVLFSKSRSSKTVQTRRKTSVPFVPPNPKLFFTATSIFISRAVLAQ